MYDATLSAPPFSAWAGITKALFMSNTSMKTAANLLPPVVQKFTPSWMKTGPVLRRAVVNMALPYPPKVPHG